MKKTIVLVRPLILTLLALTGFTTSTLGQVVTIPDPGLNAVVRAALNKPTGPITQQDMLTLTNLTAITQNVQSIVGLETALNLALLDLQDNHITNVDFPTNLTHLVYLDLSENPYTSLTLSGTLTNLTRLRNENGHLTNLTLSAGLARMTNLSLAFNQLTSLTLPADMTNLSLLSIYQNQLTNLTFPPGLATLVQLDVTGNQLTSLPLPSNLAKLLVLNAGSNHLTNYALPSGLTNLNVLRLTDNQLTNLTLTPNLNQLSLLDLTGNNLTSLSLPPGLTSLAFLNVNNNQLGSLTFPPDLQQLIALFFAGNSFTNLVLSEPLASAGLASVVDSLSNQGIPVFTYPLDVHLVKLLPLVGAFKFGLQGPPGFYTILQSADYTSWSFVGVTSNPLGSVNFVDPTSHLSPQKFYRALRQTPPTNMVFISPKTFTMGTPPTEVSRQADEGPQTTVTLSRGFWIGKYEVTQREYLAVIGSNPSGFPGDLNRPVESVSWLDATNYCAKLTEQELAAGRIPPGTHFRLPTEAEWECAARAGTSTRFSYGDDPNLTNLVNNAWYAGNSGFGTHPVGLKAPNPWGLYDMEGNVLEWVQDWYGPYPGGSATDPQGPASNVQGVKVIRGGAWDSFEADCRSGRRQTEGVSPFITDFILGFRVVLVMESP